VGGGKYSHSDPSRHPRVRGENGLALGDNESGRPRRPLSRSFDPSAFSLGRLSCYDGKVQLRSAVSVPPTSESVPVAENDSTLTT